MCPSVLCVSLWFLLLEMDLMAQTQLLIVADDPLARAGLAAILAGQATVTVAGQTGSADLAAALRAFLPDVIVWDLGWEPERRIEALSSFTDSAATPVVALLATPAAAGAARAAGARGLLARDVDGAQIAVAVGAVLQDLLVFGESLVALPAAPVGDEALVEPLSARELEVLRRMAEGRSNKQIARDLEISEHTVKFHVNAVLGKLGAQSRTEAVVRATRAGLILL